MNEMKTLTWTVNDDVNDDEIEKAWVVNCHEIETETWIDACKKAIEICNVENKICIVEENMLTASDVASDDI